MLVFCKLSKIISFAMTSNLFWLSPSEFIDSNFSSSFLFEIPLCVIISEIFTQAFDKANRTSTFSSVILFSETSLFKYSSKLISFAPEYLLKKMPVSK